MVLRSGGIASWFPCAAEIFGSTEAEELSKSRRSSLPGPNKAALSGKHIFKAIQGWQRAHPAWAILVILPSD
jgi:hypothetical protein